MRGVGVGVGGETVVAVDDGDGPELVVVEACQRRCARSGGPGGSIQVMNAEVAIGGIAKRRGQEVAGRKIVAALRFHFLRRRGNDNGEVHLWTGVRLPKTTAAAICA